jgi:hypothetical protein
MTYTRIHQISRNFIQFGHLYTYVYYVPFSLPRALWKSQLVLDKETNFTICQACQSFKTLS